MMWPDYSCCDFCPYGLDDPGAVCENCDAIKAERRLCRMIADLETDLEQICNTSIVIPGSSTP